MKTLIVIIITVMFSLLVNNSTKASNFVAGDLTYTCLGGNTYIISFSYYRDCSGSAAPNQQLIYFACSSDPTYNFSTNLTKIAGTGQELYLDYSCDSTTCEGGNGFGVQEYVYQAHVTLPACDSWNMFVSGCCRNDVPTITGGLTNTWYMESMLNNAIAPYNSSSVFSNKPVVFRCIDKYSTYYHGAMDADGDSLVYSFVAPKINGTSTISYNAPWSAANFLATSSGITLNPISGTISFISDTIMSSITAIKIEEWRTINGVATLVGYTIRDLQFHIKPCLNEIPVLSGIDTLNTHTYNANDTTYSMQFALGQTVDFDINGYDADTIKPGCAVHSEAFSISWNNEIPSAVFTPFYSQSDSAYAHFSWLPSYADVASSPHCFTATINDGAAPYSGYQTYTYCVTVTSGVGIDNIEASSKLKIFPNPSSGIIDINYKTNSINNCYLSIYSIDGKRVYNEVWKQPSTQCEHKLDLSYLLNGLYYINIIQDDENSSYKIIIEK